MAGHHSWSVGLLVWIEVLGLLGSVLGVEAGGAFIVDVHTVSLVIREAGRVRLNHRHDEAHEVFQVWLLADVPACQVCNRDFILGAYVVFRSDNFGVEGLVNVDLWGSKWEIVYQHNFYLKVFHGAGWGLCLHTAFEYQHVAGELVSRQLKLLSNRLEVWIGTHEGHGLLNDEVCVLAIVAVSHPLLELWVHLRLLIHFFN